MKANKTLLLLVCGALASCTQQPSKDPLQNTKKLAREGHATLYDNGAFEVPMTTIHIIPPGPSTLGLAAELSGVRARQSFQESLKHARESGALARAGIDKSRQAGQVVKQGTSVIAEGARDVTRYGAELVGDAPGVVHKSVDASIAYSGKAYTETRQAGAQLAESSLTAGSDMSEGTSNISGKMWTGTLALAKDTSASSLESSGRHATYAAERFVKGYATLPEQLGKRADAVKKSASLGQFVNAFRKSNEWRSEQSDKMTNIVVGTATDYTKDIKESFSAAGREISEGSNETGYTLALLKSLRWVVQGVVWDGAIKPTGKLAASSLGYVTVNTVAFPAMVTVREGVAVTEVAVEVGWNSAASVYDVTAPSATAALAGLFSAVELVGGQALAGGELVGGSAATAGAYGVGKTAAAATAGGGYLTGKTVQYVGAPLSTVGVAAGGSAIGVVGGVALATGGAALATVGVAGEATTRVTGTATQGAVVAGGSTASVAAGAALGTYELSKAVVAPVGYELGAGLVLGYGTLSQFSAQSVLAVSDASYLVLSMEGPNWVLYAVKGNVDNGENIPAGTMLDLKSMQQAGETFTVVPLSDEEMKRIVNTVPAQLPPDPRSATSQPVAPPQAKQP